MEQRLPFDSFNRGSVALHFPEGKYSMVYSDALIRVHASNGVVSMKDNTVYLCDRDAQKHRIGIAELFLTLTDPGPAREPESDVRFRDRDTTNCAPSNVYWETQRDKNELINAKKAALAAVGSRATLRSIRWEQRGKDGSESFDYSKKAVINQKTGVILQMKGVSLTPRKLSSSGQITLTNDGTTKKFLAHKIYQLMFDSEEYWSNPALCEVGHINGDVQCNEPWNLRWMTDAEIRINRDRAPHAIKYVTFNGPIPECRSFGNTKFGRHGEIFNASGKIRTGENTSEQSPLPVIGIGEETYFIHHIIAYLFLWPDFARANNIETTGSIEDMRKSPFVVRHLDNDKTNYKVSNLELVTPSEKRATKRNRFGLWTAKDGRWGFSRA